MTLAEYSMTAFALLNGGRVLAYMPQIVCVYRCRNRAVAVSMASGPAAGLELVDALTAEPSLQGYHLLPSVRGDLLAKLGRFEEARAEFECAASLTRNERERALLLERARAC